jgi:peptidoglycan/xylan/chitin deacetylase (PgdA/CDA1 family)
MAPSIPVLTFHALDEGRDAVAFSPPLFQRCMAFLDEAGFRILTLADLLSQLRGGGVSGQPALAITFDDGYRSVYDVAFPVLSQMGAPATVFVSPMARQRSGDERLPPQGGRERLSWAEMDEMGRCGFEFGAHTVSHCDLTRVDETTAGREILESKSVLEQGLSRSVDFFAYPFGRYDRVSRDIVSKSFEGAFSDRLGLTHRGDDLFALPRVEMHYFSSERTLPLLLDSRLSWYLSVRRLPRWIRRAGRS